LFGVSSIKNSSYQIYEKFLSFSFLDYLKSLK